MTDKILEKLQAEYPNCEFEEIENDGGRLLIRVTQQRGVWFDVNYYAEDDTIEMVGAHWC